MTMAGVTAREQDGWLTTILRPAGSLDQSALHRLSESIGHLAACSNMVVIDLAAADVGNPRAFARQLLAPALVFERAEQGSRPGCGDIASMSTCSSVSYTHLRAHETRHDLVCRLL